MIILNRTAFDNKNFKYLIRMRKDVTQAILDVFRYLMIYEYFINKKNKFSDSQFCSIVLVDFDKSILYLSIQSQTVYGIELLVLSILRVDSVTISRTKLLLCPPEIDPLSDGRLNRPEKIRLFEISSHPPAKRFSEQSEGKGGGGGVGVGGEGRDE